MSPFFRKRVTPPTGVGGGEVRHECICVCGEVTRILAWLVYVPCVINSAIAIRYIIGLI